MKTLSEVLHFLNQAMPLLLFVACWALTRWGSRFGVSSERQRALQKGIELAHVFVGEADAMVRAAKDPARPGTWTAEDGARLMDAVVERLASALGPDLPHVVSHAPAGVPPEAFLRSLAESAVTALKAKQPGAPPTAAGVVQAPAVAAETPPSPETGVVG